MLHDESLKNKKRMTQLVNRRETCPPLANAHTTSHTCRLLDDAILTLQSRLYHILGLGLGLGDGGYG